jgi:hypothetical protein
LEYRQNLRFGNALGNNEQISRGQAACRPLMIVRAKKRRAQQDKNPYCREHSESNTEHGHLLTPVIPNSPVKVYDTTGLRSRRLDARDLNMVDRPRPDESEPGTR